MTDFNQLFALFAGIKAGVIGDVMLDTYIWGRVDRISPEAPVPVVALQQKEQRIGGAGNVALNLESLGATVSMLTVYGKDEEGYKLRDLLTGKNVNTAYSFQSEQRITTNKTRIISRNQQMLRLDAEITTDLESVEEEQLLRLISDYINREQPQVIIFEDYNKGVLTERVITETIRLCKQKGIVTTVDPKRKNFFAYKGVDLFKPNLKEVKEALHILSGTVSLPALQEMHQQLAAQLQHQISFITLSEKGVFFQQDKKAALIPTHVRSIADVSGAGDTVIAVASLVFASTKDMQLAAEVANIAGGLVCEEVGTAVIDKEKLLAECKLLLG
jgi:D-glycero-beta-D-manno-heptose-7-phosphate kinase